MASPRPTSYVLRSQATSPETFRAPRTTLNGFAIVSSKRRLRGMPRACWSSQSRSGRSQSRSPVLHCNFGGALSALSVDTGFSCVADSDLSGQVRRFASDESAASSRQSVGCGCLLGPVATAVNRLYRNSASSMYQRVLVVVSNSISDREYVMRSPTPSLPAT